MTSLSDNQFKHLRAVIELPDFGGTRYEIIRRHATGGMGTVYLAKDNNLDRTVALKVLSIPDSSGQLAARMRREARIVAQLEHPCIVPIHDVGQLTDGRVYYTMKYVQGPTLEEYSLPGTPLNDQLRILVKVCEAVAFAHSRGVLHRDLKPSNIMVGAFGEVLVMDWGVAMNLQDPRGQGLALSPSDSATHDGAIVGTPGYMSPEQAGAQRDGIDHRTDIYGLGALLYFVLTGRQPVAGQAIVEILEKSRSGAIARPRALSREIPKRIEAVCLRALALNPDDRYDSAEALARDLENFLDGEPVGAYKERLWEKSSRWLGRNRFIVIIVLAYMIVRFLILLWRGI